MDLTLAIKFAAAIFLRHYNLDWDRGTIYHPDELQVANTITHLFQFVWPPDRQYVYLADHSRLILRSAEREFGKHHDFIYGALIPLAVDVAATEHVRETACDWLHSFGIVHMVGPALLLPIDSNVVRLAIAITHPNLTPK